MYYFGKVGGSARGPTVGTSFLDLLAGRQNLSGSIPDSKKR